LFQRKHKQKPPNQYGLAGCTAVEHSRDDNLMVFIERVFGWWIEEFVAFMKLRECLNPKKLNGLRNYGLNSQTEHQFYEIEKEIQGY